MPEGREDRLRQLDDESDAAEKNQAHTQGQADPDPTGLGLVGRRQLVGQDGDEDEVVDAEHHPMVISAARAAQTVGLRARLKR